MNKRTAEQMKQAYHNALNEYAVAKAKLITMPVLLLACVTSLVFTSILFMVLHTDDKAHVVSTMYDMDEHTVTYNMSDGGYVQYMNDMPADKVEADYDWNTRYITYYNKEHGTNY